MSPAASATPPAGEPADDPTRGPWRAAAARELTPRGASPDEGAVDRLTTRSEEGVEVRPLYGDRVTPAAPEGAPGDFPYVRGARPAGTAWIVATRHDVAEITAAAGAIAEDVARGARGIVIAVDRAGRLGLDAGLDLSREAVGDGGVAIVHAGDLEQLLGAIDPHAVCTWIDAGANAAPFVAGWLGALDERGIDPRGAALFAGLDPAGALARDGALPRPASALGAEAAELVEIWRRRGLAGRPLAVSSVAVHEASGHAAHEIGFLLAGVAELLRALEAREVGVARAAASIALEISVGPDVFGAISKIRALRLAWSKLLVAAGLAPGDVPPPFVAARTSARAQSRLDPWTNAVRATTEAFAAAAAGVDLLVVRPFDEPLGASDRAARRLARNTQIVLRDEAHLADVADPAAGSGFVEHLTGALAEAGWAELGRLEREGGLLAALASGAQKAPIVAAAAARGRDVARRRRVIVGASDFASPRELAPPRPPRRDPAAAERAAKRAVACRRPSPTVPDDSRLHVASAIVARGDSFAAAAQVLAMFAPDTPPSAEALVPRRDAARFEALRDRTSALRERAGGALRAVLLPVGDLGPARPRLGFSQRLLEVGGFDVDVEGPVPIASPAAPAGVSDAAVVVLCGPDDAYAAAAEAIARSLLDPARGPRAPVVALAGKPAEDRAPGLREAGISAWFFAGGDVAEVLEEIVARVEVRADRGGAQ